MLATIIAIAAIGQLRPDTMLDAKHDARFARWVQEARQQANVWATGERDRVFSSRLLTRRLFLTNPAEYRRLIVLRDHAEKVFREAAYRQICDAYDISIEEFRSMAWDQDVRRLRHDPEPSPNPDGKRIRFGNLDRTRFDPTKVRLPKPYDKLAGKIQSAKPSSPKVFSEEAERNGAGNP